MATDAQPSPPSVSQPSPWARIAGAAGVAFDARKIILAAVGLLGFWAGSSALDWALLADSDRPTAMTLGYAFPPPFAGTNYFLPEMYGPSGLAIAEPAWVPMRPFAALFATHPSAGGTRFLHALLTSIWAAAVWGLVGGAIARVAAVQLATGERIGIATASKFALRKGVGLVGSPLCPLIAVGLFGALCGLFGLLYWIPGNLGATIAGALAFLPLLAGLVMALILAGLAAGWPLMIATVAAEGEDAFDALSRSYAYVFQRPARYVAYILWAGLVGFAGLLIVSAFAWAVPHLAEWGLAFGAPDALLADLFHVRSPATGPAAAAHRFWLGVIDLLARSWIYAYFWTAATQIYLLLRRDVDGTPLGEIYLPEHDADTFAPDLPTHAKPEPTGEFAGVPIAPVEPPLPDVGA